MYSLPPDPTQLPVFPTSTLPEMQKAFYKNDWSLQHPPISPSLTKELRAGGKAVLKLYSLYPPSPQQALQTGYKLTGLVKQVKHTAFG